MVSAGHYLAAEVGRDVLAAGGTAADAAVATGFALAVVLPNAGNLGGGGFALVREPGTAAAVHALDFRETAPAAATATMYQDSTGAVVPGLSRVGALASGVPGSVAGLVALHERYGRLPLSDLIAPAVRLAADGFRLPPKQARAFNSFRPDFERFASTARYFIRPDDQPFEPGDSFIQSDLAETLRRIQQQGADGFYRGETARLIARQMERSGGLITEADLAAYHPVWREPVCTDYRGHRVCSMPPPSSGGVALAQLLEAVEPFDPDGLGFHTPAHLHLYGEAMRRTYADRARWLGDADFVRVPVAGLIDSAYTAGRMATFDPARTTPSAEVSAGQPAGAESPETTHFSVVDGDGLAVSLTTTINASYGSKLVVDGAGFFLNDEMDDFAAAPGVPNQYGLIGAEANAVAPGKRPLSSMTPTVMDDPDGRLLLVLGSPGGSRIITAVFQTVTAVVDFDLPITEAVAAPRFHHQWRPDYMRLEPAFPGALADSLRALGWTVERGSPSGAVDAVYVRYPPEPVLVGAADPRRETDAAYGLE
jgi:gamma-glutamyltranspeptidase/glutathione hydrolase